MNLSGMTAFVTGGGRGIGRAVALRLAQDGANVGIGDILLEGDETVTPTESQSAIAQMMRSQGVVYARKTAADIRALGRKAEAYRLDVTDRAQAGEVFARAEAELGPIDILVNNAATLDHVAALEHQVDELWDRDLRVNLTGAYNCTKAVWPGMKARNFGRVFFLSSIAGVAGGFGQASYAASKAAIIGLAKSLALEGARSGITTHVLVPGLVNTEAATLSPAVERIVKRTVFRRMAEPAELAHTVAFLASREAGYITGAVHDLTGGLTLFTY